MKAMLKKTICIISSAIMLCGASAIPANAKDPTFRPGGFEMPQLSELVPVDTGKKALWYDYYLNSYSFEITPSETANIEAKTDRSLPFGKVAEYQWYRNGKPITGATKSTYPATEAGKYYCEITERDREFQAIEIATTTTTTKSIGLIPVGTRTTTAAMQGQTIDIGQRFAPVTTAILPGVKAVKTYKTGEAIVKRVPELTIKTQSYDGVQLRYDTKLFVSPTGGSGTYYYRWTDAKGNWVGSEQRLPVAYEGTYKCEVRDSSGRKVESSKKKVSYDAMNLGLIGTDGKYRISREGRLYEEAFEQSDDPEAQKTITVEPDTGTGKYKYNWQREIDGKWVDMDWHSATLKVRKKDIKDSDSRYYSEYIGGNQYWIQHMKHNNYRCQVSCVNCKGEVVETKNTSYIQINSRLERYIGYKPY